jgi:hypothetical protein
MMYGTTSIKFASLTGAPRLEPYFLEDAQALPVCPSGSEQNVGKDECVALVHGNDRGKPKYSEKNLSQCQFAHHTLHMD